MKQAANVSAFVSVCSAVVPWLESLEHVLRIAGIVVALVAGVLSIAIHWRTLRKRDKK